MKKVMQKKRVKRFDGEDGSYVGEDDSGSGIDRYLADRASSGNPVTKDDPYRYYSENENPIIREQGPRIAASNNLLEMDSDVRQALAGKRPPPQEYTQLPESKKRSPAKAKSTKKSSDLQLTSSRMPDTDRRNLEATMSRGRPGEGSSQIPGQSLTAEQRRNIDRGDRVTGTEASRNISNTLNALTPIGGGSLKVATELAMANRGTKAAQALKNERQLSASGQRLKNLEELRDVAYPGRREAVMNPSAWTGGPKAMEKIAQVEGRAAQAEAKAAQAAARREAAEARRNARDPVMQIIPGESSIFKRGGAVKKMSFGGSVSKVSSASRRGDGIASRGKTRGKFC